MASDGFEDAVALLPQPLQEVLMRVPSSIRDRVQEIRLRKETSITLSLIATILCRQMHVKLTTFSACLNIFAIIQCMRIKTNCAKDTYAQKTAVEQALRAQR